MQKLEPNLLIILGKNRYPDCPMDVNKHFNSKLFTAVDIVLDS